MPSTDLTDYVRTGETRVPSSGEFFIFDRGHGNLIVLQQNDTPEQPRHAAGAIGKGWADSPRQIVVPAGRTFTVVAQYYDEMDTVSVEASTAQEAATKAAELFGFAGQFLVFEGKPTYVRVENRTSYVVV